MSKGLQAGLEKHSTTCGVHQADVSYGLWNWAKGMKYSVVMSSLMRHLSAIQAGEENDPESGLPHMGHAMCNMIMLSHYSKHMPEMNDFNNPNLQVFKGENP
jgi:hypothetical protein